MATRFAFLASLLLALRRRAGKTPAPEADTLPNADLSEPAEQVDENDRKDPTATLPSAKNAKEAARKQTLPKTTAWAIDDTRLVFGMRWSPISQDASLATQLKQARRTGYVHHVVSQPGSTLGLMGPLTKQSVKAAHSVAMVLAEHFSTSGAELFVFEHEGLFGLVGLADNNPTPGFDTQGSREEMQALGDEFMAMNTGQSIRLVGNVDWLPDMTDLQPMQVAERANKRSRLRLIPNPNLKIGLAVLTALVLSGFAYAYYVLEVAWQKKQAEQVAEKNINARYETSIKAAIKSVGATGDSSLTPWRDALRSIPLAVAGWQLRSLSCRADKCTATWARVSGNFAEFDSNFPYASKQRPALKPGEKNEHVLETEHPVKAVPAAPSASAPEAAAQGLQRANLPTLREAYLEWGSFILDAQLLPRQVASLRPANLFGGEGPIEEISKPVLKGGWQLESDLWSLQDLQLPHYVVVESLGIARTGGGGGPEDKAFAGLIASSLGYRYKIEGSFYAKPR
jgi:hypothetical protein